MERINGVIQRLIDKETVFSTIPITNGNIEDLVFLGKSGFDLVMIESEHLGYDPMLLRSSFQFLMNRARVIRDGARISPAPFVRVPANTRERNEWIIKQTLDAGALGLILPHLDSVEGAQAAVAAARYPRPRGAPDAGGGGIRGWSPFAAADYWGLNGGEYYQRAGIWPLDPDGELLLMGIVESVEGIRRLPEVLSQVKGIGAVWAGSGDLSVSMGLAGDAQHEDVEREVLNILQICKDHGVACAVPAGGRIGVEERVEQGFEIVLLPLFYAMADLQRGLANAGR